MNTAVLWAMICALLWTAGMIYFDWIKKRKK